MVGRRSIPSRSRSGGRTFVHLPVGVMLMKPSVCGFLFFIMGTMSFVACGGGGGGSTSGGSGIVPTSTPASAQPTPTPTATPATAPASLTVSGNLEEFASGTALAGFTVTVGSVPNATTCLNAESATAMPCGVPASPLPTVATSATGTFSIAVPAAGTYMLTIGKDATYATLHRTITVITGSSLALGTLKVAALSSDEQAWLIDVNHQRATVSIPISFANLAVDEYAEEQARQWANDVLSGETIYGDSGYAPYQSAYGSSAGSLYSVAGALNENTSGQVSAYTASDNAWMSEKSNCPNGNWQTCTFAGNTGHYINISNTQTVWIGLGEAWNLASPMSQYSFYDLMLIENIASTGPTFRKREAP